MGDADVSLWLHYSARSWGNAGYLRVDQIKAGIIRHTWAANVTDGCNRENLNLALNYRPNGEEERLHSARARPWCKPPSQA